MQQMDEMVHSGEGVRARGRAMLVVAAATVVGLCVIAVAIALGLRIEHGAPYSAKDARVAADSLVGLHCANRCYVASVERRSNAIWKITLAADQDRFDCYLVDLRRFSFVPRGLPPGTTPIPCVDLPLTRSGVLTVATAYAPADLEAASTPDTAFLDAALHALARRLGVLAFSLVGVPSGGAVENGADATLVLNDGSSPPSSASKAIRLSAIRFVVLGRRGTSVASLAQLRKMRLGVYGTLANTFATATARLDFRPLTSPTSAVAALKSRHIDGLVTDMGTASQLIAQAPGVTAIGQFPQTPFVYELRIAPRPPLVRAIHDALSAQAVTTQLAAARRRAYPALASPVLSVGP